MFLDAIELRGFKSFADKTEVNLKKGITAIVGPNGSGKSNISDAIRWVLGEQSVKNLRGGKMEDVIFAGTAFRKAVGLAQVSLILDNKEGKLPLEYDRVTISRRLFRSGESEYYINKTKCRLKDIHELFMDTGIGKEGYSIISQGKIEALLSGSTDDRRGLLEEAAGIVKYKSRKNEAEKKLNSTNQNIMRIDDILLGYKERLEPLEKEQYKAKRFLHLSKELKDREVSVLLEEVKEIEEKIRTSKESLEKIKAIYDEKNTLKEKLKLEEKNLTSREEEIENKSSLEKEEFNNIDNLKRDKISENKILEERLKNSENLINTQKKELLEFSKELELMETKNSSSSEEYKRLKDKNIELKNKFSQVESEVLGTLKEIDIKREKISSAEKEEELLKQEKVKKEQDIAVLENSLGNLNSKRESIMASLNGETNLLKINETTKADLLKQVLKVKEEFLVLNVQSEKEKNEIIKLNRNKTLKEKDLKFLLNDKTKKETNKQLLENLEKQYEGYTKSVKNIMKHIDEKKVVLNDSKAFVVGEVISIDKRYETAIEIALGATISNIIVDREDDAKILINHLKKNNLGRATFLPLDSLRFRNLDINENIKNTQGYIGVASELVECDAKFLPVMRFLLGRCVIAKKLDCATKIARNSGYSFRIITLEGDVVSQGGSLTGGSIYNKTLNIIGRKREIQDLESDLKRIEKEINSKNAEIESLEKIIDDKDEKILNIKEEIHSLNIDKIKLEERLQSIETEVLTITKSIKSNREIYENILKELKNLEDKINTLGADTYEILAKEVVLKEYIDTLKGENLSIEETIEDKKNSLNHLQVELAKNNQMVENYNNNLEKIREDIIKFQNNIKRKKIAIDENEIFVQEIKERIKVNTKELEEFSQYLEGKKSKLLKLEVLKIDIKEKLKNIISKIEDLSKEMQSYEEQRHRYDIILERNVIEKENIIKKLNEDYEMTFEMGTSSEEKNFDLNAYKKEIADIKGEISLLGNVNVGSIEEFKEVKEKFTFMNTQREDLIFAKDELLSVIEEMTIKISEVFNNNFHLIRKLFNETFKELFKGGSADLYVNGDDILSAPIEINVQPPGKKLQNINLMSGGEKGLSAIALLFAILKMKPTPFCILDEIEAALDDVNVLRYAEFLRKFSKSTQFIVITHRKGTMESSDILYGVTMEEKGISKVVSVDLEDTNMVLTN